MKLSDRNASWAHAWRRRPLRMRALLAVLAAAGMASVFAAGPASAAPAAPPAPAPGATPGTTVVGADTFLAYLDTTGSVWVVNLSTSAFIPTHALGAGVNGGPALVTSGSSVVVFVRGAKDNQLYAASCSTSTCSDWSSLGGVITSKPGAVFTGPNAADYSVYARGNNPNTGVWGRVHTSSGWGAWTDYSGGLYPDTGPSAAFISGHVWLLVTGGSGDQGSLYIKEVGVTGWDSVGGLSTETPALTTITGSLVGFARGVNGNAAFYHRFQSGAMPNWNLFGGVFNSGLAASSNGTTTTRIFGTDTTGAISGNTGTWTTDPATPPAFTGWTAVIV